jgi:signal transduction histidine kinase
MQQMEGMMVLDGAERKRVETVVETLATMGNRSESLAEVAHDARNMVTALGLYCDLLDEPGVLAEPFAHYGSELKLVASASRRLVEKLVALDSHESEGQRVQDGAMAGRGGLLRTTASLAWTQPARRWDLLPAMPIEDLAEELHANRNLLAALAGPTIPVTVETEGGALPVRLTGEDLTRILVNLVKNAAEAMPEGGRIHLVLRESPARPDAEPWLTLNVEDTGPGIPDLAMEEIFEAGYTTRMRRGAAQGRGGWRVEHRGLGLSIARSILEAAGGRIHAANRDPSGACFQIELPVRTR